MTEHYAEPYAGECTDCDATIATEKRMPMGENAPGRLWVRCGACESINRLERDS